MYVYGEQDRVLKIASSWLNVSTTLFTTLSKILYFILPHFLSSFSFPSSQCLFISLQQFLFISLSLQNLPTEHARQAFRLRDKDQSGTIPAIEFVDLMTKIREFRLSEHVQDHLLSVCTCTCVCTCNDCMYM